MSGRRLPHTFVCLSLLAAWVALGAGARAEEPPEAPKDAEAPAVNYFDFWNLSSSASTINDAWKVIGESQPDQPDWRLKPPPIYRPEAPTPVSRGDFTDLLRRLAQAEQPAGSAPNPWSMSGLRRDPGRLTSKQETQFDVLQSQVKFDLPDPEQMRWDPLYSREWKAEESLKLALPVAVPLADSTFLFSSLDSKAASFDYQQMKVVGKTGVGVKWTPLPRSELQIRGGPMVTYTDPYASSRSERSQVMVELLAKAPLFGQLQLEYTGTALPALLPTDKDEIKQDLKVALPIGPGSEFYLGARYRWEYVNTPTPWIERAQLYLGLELKH